MRGVSHWFPLWRYQLASLQGGQHEITTDANENAGQRRPTVSMCLPSHGWGTCWRKKLPSGNLSHSYGKWPIYSDFPIKNGDVAELCFITRGYILLQITHQSKLFSEQSLATGRLPWGVVAEMVPWSFMEYSEPQTPKTCEFLEHVHLWLRWWSVALQRSTFWLCLMSWINQPQGAGKAIAIRMIFFHPLLRVKPLPIILSHSFLNRGQNGFWTFCNF